MFKKKCKKCGEKIEKKYAFCPSCGENLKNKENREDYGFLGINDSINENELMGFNTSFIDKLFNNAMKVLEKQMRELPQEMPREIPNEHIPLDIQFFVNGKKISPNVNRIQSTPVLEIKKMPYKLSKEKIEKISKLPKQEPNSKMRRLANKVIYELEVPGIKDIENILINKLETSIEIKAIAKDKVYSKILNINLPLIEYQLINEDLILEFQAK